MKRKITNIIGMLEMGIKTDEQAIAELLDLFSVINIRELLIDFSMKRNKVPKEFKLQYEKEVDEYLKSINNTK